MALDAKITFLIDQYGAEKVTASLNTLTGATDRVGASASSVPSKMKPFKSGMSDIASSIMGPVGAATAVAMLGSRLVEFASQHATTDSQRAEFDKLSSTLEASKNKIGEAAAAALANSGALELMSRGVELLTEQLEPAFAILELMGPVFKLIAINVEISTLPIRKFADGLKWLIEKAEEIGISFGDASEDTKSYSYETLIATERVWGLVDAENAMLAVRAGDVAVAKVRSEKRKDEIAKGQAESDLEKKRQEDIKRAIYEVNNAKSNPTYARANKEQLESSLRLLETERSRADLVASSATASLDQVNRAEQLGMAYDDLKGIVDSFNKSGGGGKFEWDAESVEMARRQIDGLVESINNYFSAIDAQQKQDIDDVLLAGKKWQKLWEDIDFKGSKKRINQIKEELKWQDVYNTALEKYRKDREKQVNEYADIIGQEYGDETITQFASALSGGVNDINKVMEAMDKAKESGQGMTMAYIESANAVSGMAGGILKSMGLKKEAAILEAISGAALESAKAAATIVVNPFESASHAIAAGMFTAAAIKLGSSGGGGGAKAAAASSKPKIVENRQGGFNTRDGGDKNIYLVMDNKIAAKSVAKGMNANASNGSSLLSASVVGGRSRRGLRG